MRARTGAATAAIVAVVILVGAYVVFHRASDQLPALRIPAGPACLVNAGNA